MKIRSYLAYFVFWAGILSAFAWGVVLPLLTGKDIVFMSNNTGIAAIGLAVAFFAWFIDRLWYTPIINTIGFLEEYYSKKNRSRH